MVQFSESNRNTDHLEGEDEVDHLRSHDKTGWHKISPGVEKKREELIEGLIEYEKATGIPETKHINKLKNCESNEEILERIKKTEKAATKWYEQKLNESGIFEPSDSREVPLLLSEKNKAIEMFKNLPLMGEMSWNMISVLSTLSEDLQPAQKFREKLGRQSKLVKEEYFRRLDTVGIFGSKEKLLENVLKEYKEVEEQPSAVQYEFKKRQKAAVKSKTTENIKQEVVKEFNERFSTYQKLLFPNKDYFGGDVIKTKWGQMPEAAGEFLEWFVERKSFAEMDNAIKKLPGLIKERQRLHSQRDEILKEALPKDRERLTKLTNQMRRHELDDYLPKLKKDIRQKNVTVAEAEGLFTLARVGTVSFIPGLEKAFFIRRLKLEDPVTQKQRVELLEKDLRERKAVATEYLSLPLYLRNDFKFFSSSAAEQEAMLLEAKEELNRQDESPFEAEQLTAETEDLTTKVDEGLSSFEGKEAMHQAMEQMKQEGYLKALAIQEQTYWKIFGAARRAKMYDETQNESYIRDLKHWTRLDQNVKSEADARTEREKNKLQFIEIANEAWEHDTVMTSSGEMREKSIINMDQLRQGSSKVEVELNKAKYGEHVEIMDAENKAANDPLKLIEDLSQQKLLELVFVALNKIGKNSLGLGIEGTAKLQASEKVTGHVEAMISKEFSHTAANNNDHYSQAA